MTKKSNAVEIVSDFCKIKPCEIAHTVAAQIFRKQPQTEYHSDSVDTEPPEDVKYEQIFERCRKMSNLVKRAKSARNSILEPMGKEVRSTKG